MRARTAKKPFVPKNIYILLFLFFYSLFALERIKKLASVRVEGYSISNELWLVPLMCIVIFFMHWRKNRILVIKNDTLQFVSLLFLIILVMLIGGFNVPSFQQYVYACFLFLVPILIFFISSMIKEENVGILLRIIVLTCLIYGIMAIILSTNYVYFMNIIGNSVDNFRFQSQYRPSMMLGSSITVSYFFNLSLPLCFYLFLKSNNKTWKFISFITIVINIVGTMVLLSRAAILITVLIIFIYIFLNIKKSRIWEKFLLGLGVITAVSYAFMKYDLTRVTNKGFGAQNNEGRFEAANLGMTIFSDSPLFGAGIARYFERLYNSKYISYHESYGLIDPHNLYILILSELGMVGMLLFILLFLSLYVRFNSIKERLMRHTAKITLFAFLIGAMGGSQLMNEISFSIVFWMYMGIFISISREDNKAYIKYGALK